MKPTHYNTLNSLFRYIGYLLLLSLFPMLAHADGGVLTNTSNGALFTPAPSDQSIIYLGELFGNIPPVLAGTGSSIMSKLFSSLNTGALALGVIIAGYTTFVGILNTAGEGEMLGKSWNSIWIPMRSVAGVGLLIPTSSGYCVCQTFMAWLLVQGIGLADTLNTTVVNYMYSGQKIFVAGDIEETDGNTKQAYTHYDPMIKNILQGFACMQAYQKEYPESNAEYLTPPSPVLDNPQNPSTITYTFMAHGTYTASNGSKSITNKNCGDFVVKGLNASTVPFIESAYASIFPSLNAAAYYMVNVDTNSQAAETYYAANPDTKAEDYALQETFNFVGSDFLTEVEKTYHSYVTEAMNVKANASYNDNGNYEDIKAYGWTSLGDLYWDMAKSYDTGATANFIGAWKENGHDISTANTADGVFTASAITYGKDWATQFVDDLIKTRSSNGTNPNNLDKDYNSGKFDATGIPALIAGNILTYMSDQFKGHQNPMVIAQRLGHNITHDIEAIYTAMEVSIIAASAGFVLLGSSMAGGSFITAPSGVSILSGILTGFTMMFTTVFPALFAFLAAILTLGATLAIVIPFIPLLAYLLAIMAWLISTLETIAAAPIVALGILHPDGQHVVWGKAEPAIMLMINIFLRPSLLVIGFVGGIILSSISIQFINLGFSTAANQLLQDSSSGISSIEAMMFLSTYVALIFACVNKSFSVIEALPNNIMRWIGHEGSRFDSGADALQKIQGSQEDSGSKSAGSSTDAAQSSGGTPDKMGDAIEKGRKGQKGFDDYKQAQKEKKEAAQEQTPKTPTKN